ncbi:MAG: nitroreductase family protein [Ignavibacteria bacterium]|nr:nitroreductase family protein [Ignavibacteria bacterium]
MKEKEFILYKHPLQLTENEMLMRSSEFYEFLIKRRTIRTFSTRNVPKEIIENCIRAAGTSPSGANLQPWHFVVISNPDVKKQIREAAEKEEREFYHGKAPIEWLDAVRPFGTDEHKPFLETAPYLIAIFEKKYDETSDGNIIKHYYTKESVGIASGILITALHNCGLSTLTHTPSPMKFLNSILNRPQNEKPFLLLVIGYPEINTEVPNIKRKELSQISIFI